MKRLFMTDSKTPMKEVYAGALLSLIEDGNTSIEFKDDIVVPIFDEDIDLTSVRPIMDIYNKYIKKHLTIDEQISVIEIIERLEGVSNRAYTITPVENMLAIQEILKVLIAPAIINKVKSGIIIDMEFDITDGKIISFPSFDTSWQNIAASKNALIAIMREGGDIMVTACQRGRLIFPTEWNSNKPRGLSNITRNRDKAYFSTYGDALEAAKAVIQL